MTTTMRLEDEVSIANLPDTPGWSENYCFDGFDQERNIGYYIHLGRWSLDSRIWREQVFVYLPDGSLLLHRGYGFRPAPQGAAGALLNLTCAAPGERWLLQYSGPARRATEAELSAAPLPESTLLHLSLDIEFTAVGEGYDFFAGRSHDGVAFAQHAEQPGRIRGRIRWEGSEVEVDAHGYRDHSRGVRNLASMHDHCWIHGHFPNNLSFGLFGIRRRKEGVIVTEFEKALVWKGGQHYIASVDRMPYMTSPDKPCSYRMQLTSELGSIDLDARVLRSQPLTVTTRFEFLYGGVPGLGAFSAFEQPTSFWWNGNQGIGHTERSTTW